MPYVPYVADDAALDSLVQGLILRQAHSILLDPFANSFNYNQSGLDSTHVDELILSVLSNISILNTL